MNMFQTPNFQIKDGHIEMLAPTFFSCGCFTGDTIINYQVNDSTLHNEPIEKFYRRYNHMIKGVAPIAHKRVTVRGKKITRVGRNDVLAVKCLGEKAVVRLSFEDGTTIRCTPDHLFWTPVGWVEAQDMAGMEGLKDSMKNTKGERKKKYSDPRVCVPSIHPYARRQTNSNGSTSNVMELHRAMFECYANGYTSLNEWRENMKPTDFFVNPKVYAIHHLDNNHFNNSRDNLCMVTDSGHKLIHSGGENGLTEPAPVLCTSVESVGSETVYDIICDTYNSYTANGFVVHNCGGIQARLSSVLVYVPMSARQLNQAKPKALQVAKDWLKQEGLFDEIPLLNKHQYGVLIDNKLTNGKHRWVDVNQGAATHVAQEFRRILNVPEPNKQPQEDFR